MRVNEYTRLMVASCLSAQAIQALSAAVEAFPEDIVWSAMNVFGVVAFVTFAVRFALGMSDQ